jgi:hypothetical protein
MSPFTGIQQCPEIIIAHVKYPQCRQHQFPMSGPYDADIAPDAMFLVDT